MATYCLVSIVKNESKNITRLLDSVADLVTEYVISDTGSTDNTVDVIKQHRLPGNVVHRAFDNFANARNAALINARILTKCDYLLLLDADMQLVVNDKQWLLDFNKDACDFIQKQGGMSYRNMRVVKRTVAAKYIGVTHEYVDLPQGTVTANAPVDAVYIADHGDGGCKADKFERDIRLLTGAIELNPSDERAAFYLAESYHHSGKHERAIEWYLRRIMLGGWHQEVWYSKFKILKCFIDLKRFEDARIWLQKEGLGSPRAEPAYHLCRALRECGQNHLAYYFYTLAAKHPMPDETDALFLEQDVYKFGLDFEQLILWYYVSKDRDYGLRLTYHFLNKPGVPYYMSKCVHDNLMFYLNPIGGTITSRKDEPYEGNWRYTTPAICGDDLVYRLVNYTIMDDNRYNILDEDGVVRTQNLWNGHLLKVTADPSVPRRDAYVMGLEDLRLTRDGNQVLGLAASMEYSNTDRVVTQVFYTIDVPEKTIHVKGLLSDGTSTQKNWVWAAYPEIVTDWYPNIVVRKIDAETCSVEKVRDIPSPELLKFMRGSSNGVFYRGEWWFTTHTVIDGRDKIRHYIHYLVVLSGDLTSFRRMTFPFTFEQGADIEFSTALRLSDEGAEFGYSIRDGTPRFRSVPWENIMKIMYYA
jgi:glycosyltransferase involved in cell wall biosynthesis